MQCVYEFPHGHQLHIELNAACLHHSDQVPQTSTKRIKLLAQLLLCCHIEVILCRVVKKRRVADGPYTETEFDLFCKRKLSCVKESIVDRIDMLKELRRIQMFC